MGQSNGQVQLLKTAERLEVSKSDALMHIVKLLDGVAQQILDLEDQGIPTETFRDAQPIWLDAAFMTSTGWGPGQRHPDSVISKAHTDVLCNLGTLHDIAKDRDGGRDTGRTTVFSALRDELEPTIELIEALTNPEMLKSLALKCATSLRTYLENPRVDDRIVMSKYSELVGLLATIARYEIDEEKKQGILNRATSLMQSVVNAVTIDLLATGAISGGTYLGSSAAGLIGRLID